MLYLRLCHVHESMNGNLLIKKIKAFRSGSTELFRKAYFYINNSGNQIFPIK